MALPSSGPLSINNIRTELGISSGSLRTLSSTAGKSTPDSISEFYGYSSAPPIYLSVSVSENSATFATSDGAALNSFNYSTSQSVSGGGYCSGGTGTTSGTLSSGSSSYTWSGFSAGQPAGGSYGNGCGVTCTSSVSASKSGYTSGSAAFSKAGSYPSSSYTCSLSAPSGYNSPLEATNYRTSSSCVDNTPSSISVSGSVSFRVTATFGGAGCDQGGYASIVCGSGSISCSSVPKNGTSSSGTVSGTPLPKNKTFIDITSASESGATLTSSLGSKAICYNGTVTFSGTANGDFNTWGGALSVNLSCTGDSSGATGSLRRSTGTSGNGTSWSDVDYGADCDGNNSWIANETITCTRRLDVSVAGVGTKSYNLSSVSVVMN